MSVSELICVSGLSVYSYVFLYIVRRAYLICIYRSISQILKVHTRYTTLHTVWIQLMTYKSLVSSGVEGTVFKRVCYCKVYSHERSLEAKIKKPVYP